MTLSQENLRQRVSQLINTQQWPAAQAVLQTLLQEHPGDASARMELAQAMLMQGKFRDSAAELLLAASTPTQHGSQHESHEIELIRRLSFSGEIVSARACLDRLRETAADSVSSLFAQAQLWWTLGEFDTARRVMDKASRIGLDAPAQFHLHAVLLQATGDIELAAQTLEQCLQRWPGFGDAALTRSNLRRQSASSNHLDYLRRQLQEFPRATTTPEQTFVKAEFESALFKELDDLDQLDEAWSALERCNALMRTINPYDGAGEATVVEALIDVAGSLKHSVQHAKSRHDSPTPIFIVGMPRSGTTLLDRILSSHSQVTSAGEINDFLRQLHWTADVPPIGIDGMLRVLLRAQKMDVGLLGERYLAQTRWRANGRRFYIDKLPINIQMVPFIRRALPHAPILHMVRDPMDVCFSNYRSMFGKVSAYSYDMLAMAHYYGLYRRLAHSWRNMFPGAMLDVDYAELVQRPEDTIRRVLAYCGLQDEPACLRPEQNVTPVATPSTMQVREPIHTRGLATWQRYADQLEPLRRLLAMETRA
jgi:tetratricopeptide (TPR) repeat protein